MSETQQFVSAAEAVGPFFVGIDLGGNNIKVGVVTTWAGRCRG